MRIGQKNNNSKSSGFNIIYRFIYQNKVTRCSNTQYSFNDKTENKQNFCLQELASTGLILKVGPERPLSVIRHIQQ